MTVDYRILRNERTDEVLLDNAQMCTSFWCHLRGLQFVRDLPTGNGLIFVSSSESVVGSSIHMLFMFIPIGVVWLDVNGVVVDKVFAKPWRPAYAPAKPAKFYIEANTPILDRVEIGDVLYFDEPSS